MAGTITISPDPCKAGETITITCSDGNQGSWELTLTDETSKAVVVTVNLNAQGSGTVNATIPSDWGYTLVIEGEVGSGLDSYSGTVGGPSP